MSVQQFKTIEKKYEQYILEGLDFDGYDIPKEKTKTDRLKLITLHNVFYSEYGFNVERIGRANALKEWLQGLPSCVDIDFYNHDIIKRAKEYGSLPQDATEKQEDKLLEKYWYYMAMRISSLWNKNKIGVDKL